MISDELDIKDIDALCSSANRDVLNVLNDFSLKVNEPTHLDGGLLDHVYFRKEFLNGKNVNSVVKDIYFSDNDAIKVQIFKEKKMLLSRK